LVSIEEEIEKHLPNWIKLLREEYRRQLIEEGKLKEKEGTDRKVIKEE